MKKIFFFLTFFSCTTSLAQKKNTHSLVYKRGMGLMFSPLSVLEPQQAAIGLGAGFRINKQFEVATEFSYLFSGYPMPEYGVEKLENLKGVRSISSVKYFYEKKLNFFVGIEVRVKQYSYVVMRNYSNGIIDILGHPYSARNTTFGGAVFWGKRNKISKNGVLEFEWTVGIGLKELQVKELSTPPTGYTLIKYRHSDVLSLGIISDNIGADFPTFPIGLRFIYHLY